MRRCQKCYVNAYINEKVYSRCGPEFGAELEGQILAIKKALYGLRTSSEQWWSHFADTLRGIGFRGTRYDKDVWIRENTQDGHYEYVCTHSDDFMIVSKRPRDIMEAIKEVYNVKSEGPRSITWETTLRRTQREDDASGAEDI